MKQPVLRSVYPILFFIICLFLSCRRPASHFKPENIHIPDELTGLLTDSIPGNIRSFTVTNIYRGDTFPSHEYHYYPNGKLDHISVLGFMGGLTLYTYDSLRLVKELLVGSCGGFWLKVSHTVNNYEHVMFSKMFEIKDRRTDTLFFATKAYSFDDSGKVLSMLCVGRNYSEMPDEYVSYSYTGYKLASVICLSEKKANAKDNKLESSYKTKRVTTYYYSINKLDSTRSYDITDEHPKGSFFLLTKYNRNSLPDSVFADGKCVSYYRYSYY